MRIDLIEALGMFAIMSRRSAMQAQNRVLYLGNRRQELPAVHARDSFECRFNNWKEVDGRAMLVRARSHGFCADWSNPSVLHNEARDAHLGKAGTTRNVLDVVVC